MTTPTGTISLADVQTEHGGSNPISLSEYYAGGAYVPGGTSGTDGAVPTSGTISLGKLRGTTNVVVNFTDRVITSSNGVARYRINSNGFAQQDLGAGYSDLEQYINVVGQAGNYEVMFVTLSGTITTAPAEGAWHDIDTNPVWVLNQPFVGSSTVSLLLQVRKIGTTTVLDEWTIDLDVTKV